MARDGWREVWLDAWLDLVAGGSCVGCGTPGRPLCPSCSESLPRQGHRVRPTPCPDGLAPCFAAGEYDDVLRAILLVGGAVGCESVARDLVQDLRDEITQVREFSSVWPDRPRVYFEEWMDPLVAGIRWVSELIEVAGGRDVFADLRGEASARGRVVDSAEVVRRDPQIILASWCGKPVDRDAIARRPGWDAVTAVRTGQLHELDGADVLAPGPSLMLGLRRIHEIVQEFQSA